MLMERRRQVYTGMQWVCFLLLISDVFSSTLQHLWHVDHATFPMLLENEKLFVKEREEGCRERLRKLADGDWRLNITRFKYLHIPKTGGNSAENHLGIGFQGHVSMQRLLKGPKKLRFAPPYVVTVRHPIDRLLSLYHFLKEGKFQSQWKRRQLYFCQAGTGRAYNSTCIPKSELSNFMLNDGRDFELPYLGKREGSGDVVGTTANFQFKILRPEDTASLNDTKVFILQNFPVIGVTDQMTFFGYSCLRLLFNVSCGAAEQKSEHHANKGVHTELFNYITQEDYVRIAQRHSLDIELYYWMTKQVEALHSCLDDNTVPC